jgi:hypothetical protein
MLFVNIDFEGDYLGQLGLFSDRKFVDFDVMILDLIEDIKIDDMLAVLHHCLA